MKKVKMWTSTNEKSYGWEENPSRFTTAASASGPISPTETDGSRFYPVNVSKVQFLSCKHMIEPPSLPEVLSEGLLSQAKRENSLTHPRCF
jgi:hypothetical protein